MNYDINWNLLFFVMKWFQIKIDIFNLAWFIHIGIICNYKNNLLYGSNQSLSVLCSSLNSDFEIEYNI